MRLVLNWSTGSNVHKPCDAGVVISRIYIYMSHCRNVLREVPVHYLFVKRYERILNGEHDVYFN
jgi:hypothetical protein